MATQGKKSTCRFSRRKGQTIRRDSVCRLWTRSWDWRQSWATLQLQIGSNTGWITLWSRRSRVLVPSFHKNTFWQRWCYAGEFCGGELRAEKLKPPSQGDYWKCALWPPQSCCNQRKNNVSKSSVCFGEQSRLQICHKKWKNHCEKFPFSPSGKGDHHHHYHLTSDLTMEKQLVPLLVSL